MTNIFSIERFFLVLMIFAGCFSLVNCLSDNYVENTVQYVNPFIGTAAYGHTFPGATLPFGMVQLSPSTGAIRDKGYSYHSEPHGRDSETILGFTHTITSGTGIGHVAKYANISLMPTTGILQIGPGTQEDPESGYRSRFSHDQEEASPGYYRVFLKDYAIEAELTATERIGVHRYRFPETDSGHIIIDITRERQIPELHKDAFIEVIGDNQVQGYTTVTGTSTGEPLTWYFFAEFSKPFDSFGTFAESDLIESRRIVRGGFGTGAYINYSTETDEEVVVKVGISFTGIEGARKNLEEEVKGFDFDKVRASARDIWNEKFEKIKVTGVTRHNKIKFYSAMYHSLLFPRLFSDVDGSYYSHFEGRVIRENDFRYYVDFSLWDTYRTTHPLFTIIEPERQIEMIKTFLAMYDQGGRIPSQVSYRNFYSQAMIGDHGSTTIIDSYVKGLRDFDVDKAYEGMLKNAFEPGLSDRSRIGLEEYNEYGYIPVETGIRETVSKVLEYSHTDWALAQVAKDLGKMGDYEFLMSRAHNYRNLYDEETGFYRPRYADGSWLSACTRQPEIVRVGSNSYYDCWHPNWIGVAPYRHYTESNAWQYLFYPQHDIHGLIGLMGGRKKFIERLDGLYYASSSNEGPLYEGVRAMLGQYIQGNQPTHHVAFLYNYAGAPWKTQERVRGIMDVFYGVNEWGLPFPDDMGEQSAWYIFSALGFYPVTPGAPFYTISSPLFEKAVINLDGYYSNRQFTILAHDTSYDNKYIQSARLNGQPLLRPWITHEEIVKGGTLEFFMGEEPNMEWGSSPDMAPPSMSSRE